MCVSGNVSHRSWPCSTWVMGGCGDPSANQRLEPRRSKGGRGRFGTLARGSSLTQSCTSPTRTLSLVCQRCDVRSFPRSNLRRSTLTPAASIMSHRKFERTFPVSLGALNPCAHPICPLPCEATGAEIGAAELQFEAKRKGRAASNEPHTNRVIEATLGPARNNHD
jgi:hypothetical protein